MIHFVWIVITGLVVGGLARLALRGRQPVPLWLTILIGIVGAVVGNIIAAAIGVRHTSGIDWIRHALQVGAAAGLIVVATPAWANRAVRR